MPTITPEEFAAALDKVSGKGGFHAALIAEMQASALVGESAAKKNATERPRSRTGRLRASLAGLVREEKGYADMAVGSGSAPERPGVPYAHMQEYGGTQRPRTAKMLRIPLDAAKTAAGVDRYPTPLRISAPDKFYLHRAKSGKLFLMDKLTGTPWYLLVHSVDIPATHFIERAFSTASGHLEGSMADLFGRVLDEAVGGA